MKEMIFRAITKVACMFAIIGLGLIGDVVAQPPTPNGGQSLNMAKQKETSINRTKGPIGTGTMLLIGLGGAYLGYKLKTNRKDKTSEKEEN